MIRRKQFLRMIVVIVIIIIIIWCNLLPSNYQHHFSKSITNFTENELIDLNLLSKVIALNSFELNNGSKLFSEQLTNDNLVIVIQVHRRVKYLNNLIDSLSNVKYINETLLIFSHDYVDNQINNVIHAINFTKFLQIYYPFSRQIWFNTFPGQSFDDCPRDIKKKKAIELNCINALEPDTYGHYREAKITQTKHHWWWKLWFVMEHLPHTNRHQGDFIFIEEDHFVSPDLIHHWKLMKMSQKELKKSSNTIIDILTLGNYEFNVQKSIKNIQNEMKKLHLTNWFSSKHNMAFTIDRSVWSRIKSCQTEFCTIDDYNWDWSLQHILDQCLKQKFVTLVPVVPRVFHIGICGGMHHNSQQKECDENYEANKLRNFFHQINEYQFKNTITDIRIVKHLNSYGGKRIKNNGGWNDHRDHQLCQQYGFEFQQIIERNPNFSKFNLKF